MAISLSTALVNRIIGKDISVVDAGSQISFTAPNLINTTQSDFLTAGFRPGMVIKVTSGGASTNAGYWTISSLVAGVITVTESTISTEAAATDTPTISAVNGSGWQEALRYGIFVVYTSPMPANADLAATGTKLLEMTVSAGSFTPGTSTNGIQWDFSSTGKIIIASGDTIQGTGLVTGTAYYGRLYDNGYITGDDSTNFQSPRIQGRVGTSGQDFDITHTKITSGVVNTLDSFNLTQPKTA